MITVTEHNATYIRIECEDFGTEQELAEFFTFFAPGYRFMPSFKNKIWDGKIRLFNQRTKALYKGLLPVLYKFAARGQYEIKLIGDLNPFVDVTREEVETFMNKLQLTARGVPLEIREYQYDGVYNMLRNRRGIAVAATSAGKSAMIYTKLHWHLKSEKSILLIVPTVNLVNQMVSDFEDYSSVNGWDTQAHVNKLFSGKERIFDKPITVSTWQTLASMMKSDKKKFAELVEFTDVLICDEAHQFKSTVVSKTVEAFVNTEFRMGTTGTLDGVNINELTLTGLLGQPFKVVTAKEMMDAGQVTKLEIKVIVLKHPDMYCKALKGMGYTEEVNQIVSNPARNSFISNLAIACKGNTLILQDFVERHGIILEEMIRQRVKEGRNVYYIHGAVDVDERERIRKIVETESDAIILATSRLFSTGVNIPSLANIIFASPGASTIQVRQSIGRGLRLKEGKFVCKVFDIADDMRWKSWKNAKFRHMESRIAIYIKEQFEYKIIQSNLTY